MNLKEIKELIELVSEKDFEEFEIERQGFRLRICRYRDRSVSAGQQPPLIVASPHLLPVESGEAARSVDALSQASAPAAQPQPAAAAEQLHTLRSPIVGTFYRAPSPNAQSFVEVGSRVSPDTVVCIIEAMKLMNEIPADIAGVVAEIYVENAQPVEYGQPLFGIRTA
jgi:acetyl-CoA carboxylase biotin carboxyl carrier protein